MSELERLELVVHRAVIVSPALPQGDAARLTRGRLGLGRFVVSGAHNVCIWSRAGRMVVLAAHQRVEVHLRVLLDKIEDRDEVPDNLPWRREAIGAQPM